MLWSNCAVFYNEKPRFIKEQEARDLWSKFCGPFTKNKVRMQKLDETGHSKFIKSY